MIYSDFKGKKLSRLGMGTMRLPVIDGKSSDINEKEVAEMVDIAIKNGVNYFDTAWMYHRGNAETVIGRALAKYPRESFYLATKFPGFSQKQVESKEEIFETQLKKCGVEYFDFYLFHSLTSENIDWYTDKKYGILDYLLEQKRLGRIKHLGFSAHASYDDLVRFLDANGEYMEFCQLQVNYLDWTFQSAKEKVELMRSRGIPVWVMEPVRGGSLASLPEKDEKALKAMRPDESIAAWSFRFLQSVEGISVILSGMSNREQLIDNLGTFSDEKPLDEKEMSTLLGIADRMITRVPCTECRYCTEYCPRELDIPKLLKVYNLYGSTVSGRVDPDDLEGIEEDKRPDSCIGCRACESVCPQSIKVSEVLAELNSKIKK